MVADYISRLQEDKAKGSATNTHSSQGATSYSLAELGKASVTTIEQANILRTRARYRSNWRYFVNFCQHLKEGFLPASPCVVRRFCEALCKEGT